MEHGSVSALASSHKLSWYPLNRPLALQVGSKYGGILGEVHDGGAVGSLFRVLSMPLLCIRWSQGANVVRMVSRLQVASGATSLAIAGLFVGCSARGLNYRQPVEALVNWVQDRQQMLHGRRYDGRPEEDARFWTLAGAAAHVVFSSRRFRVQPSLQSALVLLGGACSLAAFTNLSHAIWYYKLSNQPGLVSNPL